MIRNNKIRLTESDLNRIVKESVDDILYKRGYRNNPNNFDAISYVMWPVHSLQIDSKGFSEAGMEGDIANMKRYGHALYRKCIDFIKRYDELVSDGLL